MDAKRMNVGIFIPSCVDQYWPQTGINLIALLRRLGYTCFYPDQLTDSGQVLYMNGDREGAKDLGQRMINAYRDCDYVVSCGSGDVAYAKRFFGELFFNTASHNECHRLADKMYDVSDFLVHVAHYTPTDVTFPHRVVFMDHCRTLRDYGLHDEPRQLLSAVNGLELLELSHPGVCCGKDYVLSNHFEPISTEMARQKVDDALHVGAQYLVGTEPSCLLHLKSYIQQVGLNLQCKHLVDILAV